MLDVECFDFALRLRDLAIVIGIQVLLLKIFVELHSRRAEGNDGHLQRGLTEEIGRQGGEPQGQYPAQAVPRDEEILDILFVGIGDSALDERLQRTELRVLLERSICKVTRGLRSSERDNECFAFDRYEPGSPTVLEVAG